MARKPCIHLPGGVSHVMLRGHGGQEIFFSDDDHDSLYRLLQEGVTRSGDRVHGFCCMTKHLHVAIQAGHLPLSRGMQNVAFQVDPLGQPSPEDSGTPVSRALSGHRGGS